MVKENHATVSGKPCTPLNNFKVCKITIARIGDTYIGSVGKCEFIGNTLTLVVSPMVRVKFSKKESHWETLDSFASYKFVFEGCVVLAKRTTLTREYILSNSGEEIMLSNDSSDCAEMEKLLIK